jgi:glucose/mannose-6-phosphate isomerase
LLLALVERLGLVRDVEAEVQDAIATMRTERASLTDNSPLAHNPARRLAGQLLERNVAIFGAGDNEVIARRWKTQINELAKAWASFEGLPEMNHNTLAGLLNPESLYSRTAAIFLRAQADHPRNQMRIDATMQAFLQAGVATDAVWAKGKTKLAQMWSLLQFGDYVSYYLALLYEVDPTPVDSLTALKQRLSKS